MNQGFRQLILQTGSLVTGFMIWVIISSLIPFISADIKLTSTQTAWATAIPVILGSLLRVPIGFWTNRIGARVLFTLCFIILLLPITVITLVFKFIIFYYIRFLCCLYHLSPLFSCESFQSK